MNLDRILNRVEKPTRYIGNEINAVHKDLSTVSLRYLHAFPDVYEVGMSHLGSHILYGAVNNEPTLYCERVYAPWIDMDQQLVENDIPLFSLETKSAMHVFDVVGFTLQYELSYSNIVHMLKLGGIEPEKARRSNDAPLIVAGGPCAYNPEPLADIVDIFMIGEGETMIIDLLNYVRDYRGRIDHREFLIGAAQIAGVYVPELYEVSYHQSGTISQFIPCDPRVPQKVVKQIIRNLDDAYYPTDVIVPFGDTVHDRAVVEVFRGCTAGCRFCQAGMIYRPVREKSKQTIIDTAEQMLKNTGYQEVALSSLSTLDHSEIEAVIAALIDRYEDQKIGISLPSLRLDSLSVDVLKDIQKVRKTGLTFAPEAGTQRLRDVINKGVSDEDIDNTIQQVFQLGWHRVKLYFMLGLPTETMEDVDGIVAIAKRLVDYYRSLDKSIARKKLTITVSTSTFVPKPFTPFQWVAQDDSATIIEKQQRLKALFKGLPVTYNYHDMQTSLIESVFARGDRRLGAVILEAEKRGCRFDGWEEHFNYDTWCQVIADCGLSVEFYANRQRQLDEILPWDHIDCGVTKDFLIREYNNALAGIVTPDCRGNCVACGINVGAVGGNC